MTDALIHMRVPAAIKARWVRESRAAGMRLTEWIVQRVEGSADDGIVREEDDTESRKSDLVARQASAFRPGSSQEAK